MKPARTPPADGPPGFLVPHAGEVPARGVQRGPSSTDNHPAGVEFAPAGPLRPMFADARKTHRDCLEDAHPASPDQRAGIRAWLMVIGVCLLVWILARVVFFVGFAGSDDMYHIRFAALWDRAPQNHWEARLIANALFAGAMRLFGRGELAAALPCLISSLAVLGATLFAAARVGGLRVALWAGLLMALLPLEVEGSTVASASSVMHGLITVGTVALLFPPRSKRGHLLGPALLGIASITHFSAVFFVAALLLAGLLIDRRRYLRAAACTMMFTMTALAIDLAVFHFAYDDTLARFKVYAGQAGLERSAAVILATSGLSFVTWPVVSLLFSKALGIAGGLAMVVGVVRFRRWTPPMRVLLLGCGIYWLWVGFGTRVPWTYRPFYRMERYWQPMTLAITVLCAWFIVSQPRRWMRLATAAALLGVCIVNLAAGGSWSQSVEVSRELLAYARQRPDQRFVTDYHTLNEMFILSGVESVPNVATIFDDKPVRLLDGHAKRLGGRAAGTRDVLVNPLNVARTPDFAAFLGGQNRLVVFETQPQSRLICRWIPSLRDKPWAIRKPAAQVLAAPKDQPTRLGLAHR